MKDEGVRAVREIRERISAEFDNDVEKLVDHYIEQQKQHGTRLLKPGAIPGAEAPAAGAPRR